MKKKLLSGAVVVTMALVGCQAGDQGAAPGNMDQNRNNTGDGMTNVRNYTLERDADRFQNRDNRYLTNNDIFNNDNGNRVGDRNDGFRNVADRNDGVRNVGDRNDGVRNNNNTRYEVSKEAANQISKKVKEIDNVYVLTTDNNAYVAAELDTDNNNNNNNNVNNNNNNINNNNNDMFDDQLSDHVKKEISDIVRSVDNDIDNVYVSTNPDFFNLANNYSNDVDRGKPVEGFFDQFGNMIERLFPQNKR
ncbi:YhcN/YlaJ family sporulation lipoprotein [Oceanobacillus caeni]|uniref:YhcN/YlaJ family sporulation lipoprotein n=1 Tax=Oceanobacillus caeni TaxID=405946 RepID=UPI001FCF7C09|nr:YhcN/YlaJ family sporulation lipoprotein [Oceanobacillus caeni]